MITEEIFLFFMILLLFCMAMLTIWIVYDETNSKKK